MLKIIKHLMPEWMYERLIGQWGDGFKKYFMNTSWMFFGQMFYLLMTFFIGAWVARYLGPTNYGIANYVFAFVGIFGFIANLGIGTILARDLVKHPEKREALMGTSFILLFCGGIIAFLSVVISAFIFEPSFFLRNLIILYSSTFIWSGFVIISTFFQSSVQAKKNVSVSMISTTAASVLKVMLIVYGKGVTWLIFILVFESLLNAAMSFYIYRKNGYNFRHWNFEREIARDMLWGGLFLMLAAGASFLFLKVDQIMIKWYLGETSVGFYAAAVRLVEIWYFIPGIICSSLLPAIVNAKKVSEKIYKDRLQKLYMLLAFIGVIIAVPSTFFAPWAIKLLFGNAYMEAVPILRIYVWSGIGLFTLWGLQQYFLSENQLKVIFYLYLFPMILNILLNFLLISKFGLTGAAWATLISYSAAPILALSFMGAHKSRSASRVGISREI
ncbi:MAG: flippase [Candidatus Pacebacteria bacterium]|nr:flippase [Candidatus Paceibacterota bacterium]